MFERLRSHGNTQFKKYVPYNILYERLRLRLFVQQAVSANKKFRKKKGFAKQILNN